MLRLINEMEWNYQVFPVWEMHRDSLQRNRSFLFFSFGRYNGRHRGWICDLSWLAWTFNIGMSNIQFSSAQCTSVRPIYRAISRCPRYINSINLHEKKNSPHFRSSKMDWCWKRSYGYGPCVLKHLISSNLIAFFFYTFSIFDIFMLFPISHHCTFVKCLHSRNQC